jgi:HK97 family phage prohead protease
MNFKAFETKFEATGEGKILGRASVYDVIDAQGDIVRRGAFAADFSARGNQRAILADHDPTRSIGLGTFTEKADGLHVAIDLAMELQEARDAFVRVQKGIATGLSIGYETLQDRISNGARELLQLSLWETSVVVFPANAHARITAAKSNPQQLEELLTALRSSKIALDDRRAVADLNAALTAIQSTKLRVLIADIRSRLQ